MKRTSDALGCTVIPLQIISKTEKSPFDIILLGKIAEAVKKDNSFIEDFFILPANVKNVIPQMVKFLQTKGYDPIGIGCGIDRVKDYQRQIDYLTSEKSDVKVESFEIAMVDQRGSDRFSGTAVREALKNGDIKEFERMTPTCIHKFYSELKLKLNA
jgi:predicted nucleotidyltransferase